MKFLKSRALLCGAILATLSGGEHAIAATVVSNSNGVEIVENDFSVLINLNGFRYEFRNSDGSVIAPMHSDSGIVINGEVVTSATYNSFDSVNQVADFTAMLTDSSEVNIKVHLKEDSVRLSVNPNNSGANDIRVQLGEVEGPFYGLADDGRNIRLSEINDQTIENNGGHDRFVSTFAIAPATGFAQVAISQLDERSLANANTSTPHKVSINSTSTALGVQNVTNVEHFYYFIGDTAEIYQAFSNAKTEANYPDVKPVYGMFGIGWELWPFAKWNSGDADPYDAPDILANITRFVDVHGYELSWAVLGSGFWESGGSTVTFGQFDLTKFPDTQNSGVTKPDLITDLNNKGLEVMFGLRTTFADCKGSNDFSSGGDGSQGNCFSPVTAPYAYNDALSNDYFAKTKNGENFTSRSNIFPQWDTFLEVLDSDNADAVAWYVEQTAKWQVKGWKEDTMLTGTTKSGSSTNKVYHDGAWNNAMKALHDRGDYVMARNAYVSSPGSIQRINDTHGEQSRIPQLVLSYAASGAPNVYTDIVGNSSQDDSRYLERHAKLAALTASMSFGIEPWDKNTSSRPNTSTNIKSAVDWHNKYRPYIYSAALKTYASGYPHTATPLPIAYPLDANTYDLDDNKMWQWLIDASMLAVPLFDSANTSTSEQRDVYLPSGLWMDFNTGLSYIGPGVVENFNQAGTRMPLFIGGTGIIVSEGDASIEAEIWPIKENSETGVSYEYRHYTSDLISNITLNNTGWDLSLLEVTNDATGATLDSADVIIDESKGTIKFDINPGTSYTVTGGGTEVGPGGNSFGDVVAVKENVAKGKPVVVDSTYSSDFPGSNAVDGDNASNSSRWLSSDDSSFHYIEVDLQQPTWIGEIKFWTGFGNTGPLSSYQLEYFNGTDWVSLVSETNNSDSAVTESFNSVQAQQVRLSSNEWIKLYEIQIFEGEPNSGSSKIANTVASSSDDYSQNFTANNAVDGDNVNDASRWISAETGEHWLEVDLGATYSVDQIKFWTGWQGYNTPLTSYSLEYWDGSAWIEVVNETNNSIAEVSHNITTVETDRIRLLTTDWAKVYEVEVYGYLSDNNVNRALSATVVTSSDYNESYIGANAVDGNKTDDSSRWISAETGSHSIEVHFDSTYAISNIKFWTGWNGYNSELSSFSLDYWDGNTWVELVNENSNGSAEIDVNFATVNTDRVRLQSNDWIKLYEIEVY